MRLRQLLPARCNLAEALKTVEMKNKILIGLGVVLAVFAIYNFSLDINSKGHYFVNGIICGVGLSMIAVQLLKLRQS